MGEARVAGLERRVDKVETRQDATDRRLDRVEGVRRVARRGPARPARGGPRCPGCHLPRDTKRRRKCNWCGFVYG